MVAELQNSSRRPFMEHSIEVKGLKKAYGSIEAVKGIDFFVEKGKLFAFLGPNGAGKSTTINMICTFLKPDSGEILFENMKVGSDDQKIREKIGVIFQDNLLDRELTVEENLICRGSLYGLKGAELKNTVKKTMQLTGIEGLAKRFYEKLSGGQRRRCDIARGLLNHPKILFLDEPTTGLDPQTRKSIWETIQKLQKEEGLTVFLTTHYMEEAAEADYVVVIDEGNIVAKGTPSELKEKYAKDKLKLFSKNTAALKEKLDKLNLSYELSSDQLLIRLSKTMDALPVIEKVKDLIYGFEVLAGSMDDAFIGITGKEIRE